MEELIGPSEGAWSSLPENSISSGCAKMKGSHYAL